VIVGSRIITWHNNIQKKSLKKFQHTSHRYYRYFSFPTSNDMAPVRKLSVKLSYKRFRRFLKNHGISALRKSEKIFKTCNSSSWLKVAWIELFKLFLEWSRCLWHEISETMSKSKSHPWLWLCDKPKLWRLTLLLNCTGLLLESLM